MAHHLNYTTGAIVAIGGSLGYLKAKSIPSLVAGVGCGSLLLVSGYLCSPNGGKPDTGHQLATATSTLLVGGTLPRALKTKKFMPAGLIAAIGTISLVYNGKKAYEWENGV